MPFSAQIYRDPDLQHIRFWGLLSREDVRRQYAAGPSIPGFYPGISTLIDLRGMTGSEMNLPDVMTLRDRLAERHGSGTVPMKLALSVDDDTSFGTARVFETICSQIDQLDARVFRSLAEALDFLDLADTALAQQLLDEPDALEL